MITDSKGNKYLSELDRNASLYLQYLTTYYEIHKNPYLKHRMRHNPGIKIMRRWSWCIYLLIALLSVLSKLL